MSNATTTLAQAILERLAAAGAGCELRRESGCQQQLQSEGDLELVCRLRRVLIEQRHGTTKQVENLRVRLARIEDAAERITGPCGAVERPLVGAQRRVSANGLCACDGHQVAATLMQLKVEAEERLEAAAEAALRTPHAFRDRADLPPHRRVDVEDPIGLAVAHRAQHDGLGLDGASHQSATLGIATFVCMPNVVMYSSTPCPYCSQAKALLNAREIPFEEINLSKDAEGRVALNEKTGMMTFPQVLVDDQLIGGFQELMAADQSGKLAELLGA